MINTGMRRLRNYSAVLLCVFSSLLHAQVTITTYHNDIARTGQNTQEGILAPSNVNITQFGKLFTVPVDGVVYAQPLYLSAVAIAGGTHNVLYVATEHDSVYAIDADSGSIYARASLIPSGGNTVNSSSDLACDDLVPEVGITGTPAIDPTNGTLYVVVSSKVNGGFVQYLHALDVTTLTEKLNGPVSIQGSVPGNGYDSSGGTVAFNPLQENQRSALLLERGHVVIGWASHCDSDPWHGWVISYNASTLTQEAVFNTSPNATPSNPSVGGASGVWMSGGGPASDANGNIYFATGNGYWNEPLGDYGDSVVKLGPPSNNTFPVLDYFTPYNQGQLDGGDIDLASGGLVLLPLLPSGEQLLAQQGKQGTIYLLNTSNLGKYCINLVPPCTNSDSQIVQEIVGASPGVWGSPAYWNGHLFWAGANDTLKAYAFNANNSGLISSSPTSQSAQIFGFAEPTPVISANGNTNGILWALSGAGLFAYDATNLANLLYSSNQAPNNRDSPGGVAKFATPIIANGKVYVGTQSSVVVYGSLSGSGQTATPTFSPAAGSYSSTQSVTISDVTPGATIYYTTNGSTPTTGSSVYGGAITVSASETLQAIATASGHTTSAVGSAAYTITSATATPTFSPAAGSYSSTQSVTISDVTPGATIYYTTNGSTPTTGSSVYGGAITVSASETLQAIAVASGHTTSAVGSATYTINSGTGPVVNDPTGFSTSSGLSFLGSATLANGALQLSSTSGGVQANAAWYATPVNVQSFTTDFNFQVTPASSSTADGFTFAIQNTAAGVNATGGAGAGLGYQGIGSSVAIKFDLYNNAGEGTDSTGFYTNGASPTTPAVDMTASGVNLHSGDILHAHITYNGTTLTLTLTDTVTNASFTTSTAINIPTIVGANNAYVGFTAGTGGQTATQDILNWTYSVGLVTQAAATPTFSPAAGSYSSAQSVTISDVTPGATIYYTTNGSTPTTGSSVYGGAITVSASETLQAIATASGYTTSAVGSAAYTITSATATPTFSPAAGSYSSTQSVTISDVTPGATIYYTTNGSTPTTGSSVYGGAITVSASETLQAIATASGHTTSAVGSAAYTITSATATPTFSPAAGSYSSTQSVTISDVTPGATIYYTTNGSTPTTGSSVYGGAITVSASETLQAIATASGYTTSAVGSATYTINSGTGPVVNDPTGFSTSSGLSFLGSATLANGALQLSSTSGGVQANAAWYATPVNVQSFTTDFNFQVTPASSSTADGFTFAIQNTAAGVNATGGAGAGLGYQGIGSSVAIKFDLYNNAGEGTDSTGFYTNGASPTTPAVDMTASGVNLHSGDILHAHITYNGTTLTLTLTDTVTNASFTTSTAINIPTIVGANNAYVGFTAGTGGQTATQDILNWTYSVGLVTQAAATPTFSPAAGSYSSAQSVTISDVTPGATIYYTTNGSTPTTGSSVYGGAITVSASETLQAIATASGYTTSAVGSAAYTITSATATPTFSPAAGSYSSTQSVTISDVTPGATIYYTTNGSTPTTGSSVYGGAITVSASETLQAIATASGHTTSAVGSAAYTITSATATPTFSPAAGSYSSTQSVTISDVTPGATIYYTTNGSTPTTGSSVYGGAITVSASETLQAIATASGHTTSAVGSAAYTITSATATPTFSPAAGSYSSTQSVTISDVTPGATIYYTTNGSTPTTGSSVYGGAITVSASETLQAIAVASGHTTSAVGSATYTINSGTGPVVNDPTGFSTSSGLSFLGSATLANGALQLSSTSGGVQANAAWYATPVNVQSFTTDFNFQVTPASSSTADGFTFAIQNTAAGVNAIGGAGGNLGYQGIGSSVAIKFDLYNNAGEGTDSTGFYTNGASPTTPAVDMTASGVNLHSGDILHAHITYNGTTLTLTLTDTVTNASFTTSTAINIPTIVGANNAYVGFTAGTGGQTATQDILNWTYTVN